MGRIASLRGRLRLVAATAFVVAIAAATLAVLVTASAGRSARALSDRLVPAAETGGALLEQYTVEQTALRDYVTTGRIQSRAQYEAANTAAPIIESRLDGLVAGYRPLPTEVATVHAAHGRWLTDIAAPELDAMDAGRAATARQLQASGASRPYVQGLRAAVARLQAQVTMAQAGVTSDLRSAQDRLLVALLAIAGLLVGCIAGLLAAANRWLLRPAGQLREAAESVAAGQHGTTVPNGGPRELADLGSSVELMRTRLVSSLAEREAAEARYRALLEGTPDATIQVSPDGTIVWANAQATRMFGYDQRELVGRPVEVLVPAGARDAHPARRAGYVASPAFRPMGADADLTAVRRDGVEFPVEISLSSVPTAQGPVATAAIRDISERVAAAAERDRLRAEAERERYERRLAQSQRLESLGQLVGGVAHDFNNLLNVILGYTVFAMERIDAAARADPDWATTAGDMRQINEAAERAARLTHQLLAFGRREVIQPRVLDMNETVHGLEQLLRRTLGEHIDLVCLPDPGLWPVKVDPGQLEQVLVNLAVNARDAMPSGGKLTIDTGNVEVDEVYAADRPGLAPGNYARLRVSDSGAGISREVLARVFEPFFTTKPKGQGTGLGLATVYGIITQAGGHPQLYSEQGHGTTFAALLPATGELAVPAVERRHDRAGGQGETIVVAEDEPSLRDLVARILTRDGYAVRVATAVEEALTMVGQLEQRVDLLLTDVVMPGMLGSELAGHATALRPELRVLYMSGYAREALDAQGTFPAGGELLEKPFTEDGLLARVRQVLDRRDVTL
jgi:PAS domain S-box-containing protein